MAQNLPKCPKCGGSPCTYREIAITAMTFDLIDNKFNEADQYFNPNETGIQSRGWIHSAEGENVKIDASMEEPDNIGKVEAECGGCGHTWMLRNFRTIEALIDLHGFNKGNKI